MENGNFINGWKLTSEPVRLLQLLTSGKRGMRGRKGRRQENKSEGDGAKDCCITTRSGTKGKNQQGKLGQQQIFTFFSVYPGCSEDRMTEIEVLNEWTVILLKN